MVVNKEIHCVDTRTGWQPLSNRQIFRYIKYTPVKLSIVTVLAKENEEGLSKLNAFLVVDTVRCSFISTLVGVRILWYEDRTVHI